MDRKLTPVANKQEYERSAMPVPDESGNQAIITCWTTSAGIKAMH
jgi:hypothetical protein